MAYNIYINKIENQSKISIENTKISSHIKSSTDDLEKNLISQEDVIDTTQISELIKKIDEMSSTITAYKISNQPQENSIDIINNSVIQHISTILENHSIKHDTREQSSDVKQICQNKNLIGAEDYIKKALFSNKSIDKDTLYNVYALAKIQHDIINLGKILSKQCNDIYDNPATKKPLKSSIKILMDKMSLSVGEPKNEHFVKQWYALFQPDRANNNPSDIHYNTIIFKKNDQEKRFSTIIKMCSTEHDCFEQYPTFKFFCEAYELYNDLTFA